jgi:hypothetical protein
MGHVQLTHQARQIPALKRLLECGSLRHDELM